MIWQNPLAWAGLALVALPILIHLLGQGRARRQLFPTLRFFGTPRPLPTRRTRLHDITLLLVRTAIVAAAVVALAQPRFVTRSVRNSSDRAVARAVIVDTSASMLRLTPGTQRAIALAEQLADRLLDSTATRSVLLTSAPAEALAGAVAWLAMQPARGEIVVVSDFQVGALDRRDLAVVPPSIGVRLVRVGVRPVTGAIETRARQGEQEVIAATTQAGTQAQVEWRSNGAGAATPPGMFYALAGAGDAAAATAAAQAARSMAIPLPLDSSRAIAIVYPGATERPGLLKRLAPLHTPWMVDVVRQLRRDSLLAGEALLADRDRLVLVPLAPAASVASATLIASATAALSLAPPPAEVDPEFVPDSALNSWQRSMSATGNIVANPNDDRSDARWLWLLALVLLGVEALLRRQSSAALTIESTHDIAR